MQEPAQHTQPFQSVTERGDETERRRQVAEGLSGIVSTLNTNQPLPVILDLVVRQATSLLDADACAIYRLHDEKTLHLQSAYGLSERFQKPPYYSVGHGAPGRAVTMQHPVIVPDVITHPEAHKTTLTTIAIPLLVQDTIYGVIALYYMPPRQMTSIEVELASIVARHAAQAIRNTQLLNEVEQHAITEERNRLARELHDAVSQTLFAMTLIAEALPEMWLSNHEEGMKRLDELRTLSRGALAEMRMLLLELRPSACRGIALDDLLRQLVEATRSRACLQVSLHVERDEASLQPPDHVQQALYRIAQEALNNTVKHADASQAAVRLCYKARQIELEISDNGSGFDTYQDISGHLGLDIIRERAEAIAASLRIHSQIGYGTHIHVVWPQ